jgi:hypothetical protein
MSPTTSAAARVGRIGALAVALGVGAAVATGTGVAWANTPESGSSTPGTSPPGSTVTGSTSDTGSPLKFSPSSPGSNSTAQESRSADPSTPRAGNREARHGVAFGSGGALTSFKIAGKTADSLKRAAKAGVENDNATPTPDIQTGATVVDRLTLPPTPDTGTQNARKTNAPQPAVTLTVPSARVAGNSPAPAPSPRLAATAPDLTSSVRANTVVAVKEMLTQRSAAALAYVRATDSPPVVAAVAPAASVTEPVARLIAAQQSTSAAETAQPRVPRLVSGLLAAVGLAPLAANSPVAPAQSPALWALFAWARREFERVSTPSGKTTTAQPSTFAAAAVVDPVPSSLDSTPVGWVTGQNNSGYPGASWPQTNNTSGFGIYGTDLGIMWDNGLPAPTHYVLTAFGDTFSGPNQTGTWRSNVLLLSTDNKLSNGLSLLQTGYAYQFIPSSPGTLGLLGSEVTIIPTSGVSVGGEQYVNYMSVKSWDTPGRWTTNYSAISMYNQATDKWVLVPSTIRSAGWFRSTTPYVAGNQNFQQAAYVLEPADKVAPGETQYLYAFGTPSGRVGSAYLSRVPEADVTDLSKYEYWDGDKWVANKPAVAAPIIGDSTKSTGLFGFVVDWANDPNVLGGNLGGLFGAKTGGNVSEMSVQYNQYLDKYVVLYADGNNNIQMRTADEPQGPWSDPITIATSAEYPGLYAPMIHPWSGTGQLENNDGTPDVNNLYWNMSLTGNYNVVLMQTDLSPLKVTQV